MSNFNSYSPGIKKESAKPTGKLVSFFVQPGPRSQSESGSSSIRKSQNQVADIAPQGKSLNIAVKKVTVGPQLNKPDIGKIAGNETDERYQYLMKRGIIRRVEKDEKIIFAELPGLTGVLVVYRSPVERNANAERLNLDRRDLTQMPLLEGEERLRLLNYQHNLIPKIENLLSLPNLIFLDLYNNQIKEINGLHTVPTLRVLMLGKNLIDKIKNLNALSKLDVLDLHSNKILKIENISHLAELRVLNLANNQISVVENLEGIKSLTEVNLRRNFIEQLRGLNSLAKLQRLFLSNNKLERLENIEILSQCQALMELALDGNPVQATTNYSHWVLNNCIRLNHLDLKKITPDMKEETKLVTLEESPKIPSENLINTIEKEWKSEMERIKTRGLNYFRRSKEAANECLVRSGHAEIEGDSNLFIYGNALEVIIKSNFQETVTTLLCQYLRFDYIVQNSAIAKLKKFQKLKKLTLAENNLHSYIQLSKLESLTGLNSIVIEKNDIIRTVLFRNFIVYRFPNVSEINEEKVTDSDKMKAKQEFQSFDKILCMPSILKPHYDHEDKDSQKNYRLNSKKNSEFAWVFTQKVINYALEVEAKSRLLEKNWGGYIGEILKKSVSELSLAKPVTEEKLYII